jgi:large subunit ribosomal protein L18
MDAQKSKVKRAERRRNRVRKPIYGTPARPRLSVFRSNLHIYAQLIDDDAQKTLAAASSNDKDAPVEYGGNVKAAEAVGKKLAEKAVAKGIKAAAFDRGPFRFHGRIAALAVAATEAGLVCTDLESMKAKMAPKEKAEAAPAEKKEAKPKGEGKKEGKPKGEFAMKEKKKPDGDKK